MLAMEMPAFCQRLHRVLFDYWTNKWQQLKEKGLGRKSLEGKFRTDKRYTRKESENKRLGNFFALQHIMEKQQRNTAGCSGMLPEELNINQKKGSFVTGAASPRVSFELVITEYLVDNIMSIEKEQF